jgi:hypothetical protein
MASGLLRVSASINEAIMRRCLLGAFILLMAGALAAPLHAADKFPKNCTLPYNGTSKKHNVDKTCPPEGKVDPNEGAQLSAAHEAQNRQKNELCATGSAKSITLATFAGLQAAVDARHVIYGDRTHLLMDRTELQNLSTTAGTFSEGGGLV